MSRLILVPTPIGNLEDITLRALRVLKEADVILAEDTRTTSVLLKRYGITGKMVPYHKFNEHKSLQKFVNMIGEGNTVALVTDAGTPGVSDPGYMLVRECIAADIPVECLPGATAVIPALVNSGFPTDRFCFEGFLPLKKGRQQRIKELSAEARTVVLYESPHRLIKTLTQLTEYFGPEWKASVSRELTKIHEETVRGSLEEVLKYFSGKNAVKGEIAIVLSAK